jgi:hypothetical protein
MRIDPRCCEQSERALLHGLGVLLEAARQTQDSAKTNLERLNKSPDSKSVDATPKHKDPRIVLKDQLTRTAEIAKETHSILDGHRETLEMHRNAMYSRWTDLDLVHRILEKTVGDESSHGLTKSSPRLSARSPTSPSSMSTPLNSPQPSITSSTASSRWRTLSHVTRVAMSPSKRSTTSFSAKAAVAGSTKTPWSSEEDSALLDLLEEHGLHRWQVVAEELPAELAKRNKAPPSIPRVSGVCQARWETLLSAYMSIGSGAVPGIRKTSDMLLAARKAARDAEMAMNESAGILTRARSELSLASVQAQRMLQKAALQKSWLRTHTHLKIMGTSEEHNRLRLLLEEIGPHKLLERKLEEAERLQKGVDTFTLAEELQLKELTIEAAPVNGGTGSRKTHFLRVRNVNTGEIVLEWTEPRDQRITNPSGCSTGETDGLTQKLHTAQQASSRSGSVTPRSSYAGSEVG